MSFASRRVLVTGAAGFIGSNLVLRLVAEGADVTAVDSFERGCGANEFNLRGVEGKISFVRADIASLADRPELVEKQEFVFDLAGSVSHHDSMREPLRDLALNVSSHVALLETCRRVCPKTPIVFASTRQLYGVPSYVPVDEDHPIRPVDVNGINKRATEEYFALYARVYGMRTASLRLTNTYGPRQSIRDAALGFIGWFVNRALLDQPIQLFGGGEQLRDFSYVDDTVEALLATATTEACLDGRAFNVSGECASLVRIARELVSLMGKGTVEVVPFPPERKKIDIGSFYGTSAKLEALTGWKPLVAVSDGLGRTLDYYREYVQYYLEGHGS